MSGPSDAALRLAYYRRVTLAANLMTPVDGFSMRLLSASARTVRDVWCEALCAGAVSGGTSLYVHIPFCMGRKCHFCMYHSTLLAERRELDDYLEYLCAKAAFFAPVFAEVRLDSLYVGGGTPSLLSPRQLDRLMAEVVGRFAFRPDAERTFEQSFNTTTPRRLERLRSAGINRLSFGLQSLEENVLEAVNRAPARPSAVRTLVGHARRLGFAEINVDLMIGLPGETGPGAREGFRLAMDAGAHAVTVYVYRHRERVGAGELESYNRAHVPAMLEVLREEAAAAGWIDTVEAEHTEYQFFTTPDHLAGYALSNYRTRPEPAVGNSTLGLGRTAYSFVSDFFRAECRDEVTTFEPDRPSWVFETVDGVSRRRVYVIESLDRYGGVDLQAFRARFGVELLAAFPREIADLDALGKAAIADGHLVLRATDRLEFASLCKFFWDQEYLAALAERAP